MSVQKCARALGLLALVPVASHARERASHPEKVLSGETHEKKIRTYGKHMKEAAMDAGQSAYQGATGAAKTVAPYVPGAIDAAAYMGEQAYHYYKHTHPTPENPQVMGAIDAAAYMGEQAYDYYKNNHPMPEQPQPMSDFDNF